MARSLSRRKQLTVWVLRTKKGTLVAGEFSNLLFASFHRRAAEQHAKAFDESLDVTVERATLVMEKGSRPPT